MGKSVTDRDLAIIVCRALTMIVKALKTKYNLPNND